MYDALIVGYVLMPSHFHALLGTRDNLQLSQLMRSFKTLSSKRIRDSIPQELTLRLTDRGRFSL